MQQDRQNTALVSLRGWRPWMAVLGLAAWAGCQEAPVDEGSRSDERPGVHVLELEPEPIELRRKWIGVLEPLKSVIVTAPEAGLISELAVADGERVSRDTLLVRMEGPELSARLEVLRQREASRREELARWERLAEADAAGPSEVEEARLRLLEVGEALAELEARLQAVVLRSPVSGKISGVSAAPGTRVAGGDILLRIDDEKSLGVRLRVPARERRYLEDFERLTLLDEAGNEGRVRRVVAVHDETAARGFVTVELWVETVDAEWPSETTFFYAREREGLVVPWTAVAREDDYNWVALVTGEPSRIERRKVSLGSALAHGIEVAEGLEPGDRILRFEPRSQPEGREVAVHDNPR